LSGLAQPRLTGAVSPTSFVTDLSARFTELKAKDPGMEHILENVWGLR
jgi:hypothetical protein